jgi:hypothetical protein
MCQVYSTKEKVKFIYFPSFEYTMIYFIKFSILNTILTNQIQKYLLPTFIIPKFFKFCIQLNINPMENTMVSK